MPNTYIWLGKPGNTVQHTVPSGTNIYMPDEQV